METITIEQIHKEWFTAAETLCATYSQERMERIQDKLQRLESLGFYSTKDRATMQELYDADGARFVVEKYAISHPNNKVISVNDVRRLCEKYNLVYGPLGSFTGFVPEKNLKEIEGFYHKDLQTWVVGIDRRDGTRFLESEQEFFTEVSAKEYSDNLEAKVNKEKEERRISNTRTYITFDTKRVVMRKKSAFLIAAPRAEMSWDANQVVEDYQIKDVVTYPDPVVLFPVEDGNYFLIVTAWGDEASDEIVVNPKHN